MISPRWLEANIVGRFLQSGVWNEEPAKVFLISFQTRSIGGGTLESKLASSFAQASRALSNRPANEGSLFGSLVTAHSREDLDVGSVEFRASAKLALQECRILRRLSKAAYFLVCLNGVTAAKHQEVKLVALGTARFASGKSRRQVLKQKRMFCHPCI